jgi:CxxC motif-containing protein (DUF1111 family)
VRGDSEKALNWVHSFLLSRSHKGTDSPATKFEDLRSIQARTLFFLHDMGEGLADGISQGSANGREFRTAPLWGIGQRIFFLHDGRADDLIEAIQQHASRGSEANGVVHLYNLLPVDDRQALVNFLRSL